MTAHGSRRRRAAVGQAKMVEREARCPVQSSISYATRTDQARSSALGERGRFFDDRRPVRALCRPVTFGHKGSMRSCQARRNPFGTSSLGAV